MPKRKVAPRFPVQTAKPEKPAVAPSYFVAVLGDGLGEMLARGLTEAFMDRPEVAVLHKAHESSGLIRDDFYDWPKAIRDLLASDEKINIAVMLIGSNDHQPLRVGNMTYEPGTPKWLEAYTARIADISRAFHEKNIPLIWVGLPIMKSERLSADLLAFNDFYREQAEKTGATYVDIWEAFENDHGQYDPLGPDVNGQTVRIRTADGISFTKAGARKLAHFVEADIRRNLDDLQPKVDPAVVTVPAETPADSAGTTPIAPIVKPIAGPVLPLTGPVATPGAQLAIKSNSPPAIRTSAPAAPAKDNHNPIEPVPTNDKTAPPPGRADDFNWQNP